MTGVEHQSKWWKSMIAKHGSEAAVRAFMRESAKTSKRNKGGKGGFAAMQKKDPELHKQLSARGGQAHATSNTTVKSPDQSDTGGLPTPDGDNA